MRHFELAFLVRPGALVSPQLREKVVEQEMKGFRAGKAANMCATRTYLYDAIVGKAYVSPYIQRFDPKGVIEHKTNDVGGDEDTYDHSLQWHPIGSFLLHTFLLICHPYTRFLY